MKRHFFKRLKSFLQRKKTQFLEFKLRPILEKARIDFLSHPFAVGNKGGEQRLNKELNFKKGFFIEIGGFNGYLTSPTYFLEKFREWQGILIEPIPEYYLECIRNRPSSTVIQAALVSAAFTGETLDLVIGSHSTRADGLIESDPARAQWLTEFSNRRAKEERIAKVRATTLTRLLDEHFKVFPKVQIDLLVLDVEGFELEVLDGLDFNRYSPQKILVECQDLNSHRKIQSVLLDFGYIDKGLFSHHDYLFTLP